MKRASLLSDEALSTLQKQKAATILAAGWQARAELADRNGDYGSARLAYEEALALRRPRLGKGHPSVAETRAGLAEVLASLGQPAAAFELALQAERVAREHLKLTLQSLSERQGLQYSASRPRGLDVALSLLPQPESAGAALDAAIRARAMTFDEMAARQRLRKTASGTTLAPLGRRSIVRESGSPRSRLRAVATSRRKATRSFSTKRGSRRSRRRRPWRIEAPRRERVAAADIGFDAVQAALPNATALVSFVQVNRREFPTGDRIGASRRTVTSYLAFVPTPDAQEPSVVELGPAAPIDTSIADWRRSLLAGSRVDGKTLAEAENALNRLEGGCGNKSGIR